jgi:hypothetical protein
MSCHSFNSNGVQGFICLANIYQYKGFTFEYHHYCGPVKLRKKDLEPAKNSGRKFFKILDEWNKMTDIDKEKTRIYG